MSYKNFIFLISLIIFQISLTKDQLRWTFELINHGARSPHKDLDSDFKDFSKHQWIGQNELTGVGLRQSFLIGYRDRLRYIEDNQLISEEYDPREILIYASDNNRTLMSANALLHGLYPPGTGPTIDPSLVDRAVPPVDSSLYEEEKKYLDNCNYTALPDRMNLVPVHINFDHEFFTQYETSSKCPGLKTYEEKNKKRENVTQFLNQMKEKYKNINKIFPDKQDASLDNYEFAYTFFDTLLCLYNDAADEFDTIINKLEMKGKENEVINDCKQFLFLNTVGNGIDNDKEFINYLVSPLFKKIISFIDLRIKKDSEKDFDYKGYDLPKYYLISGVGNTCGTFMSFMNKYFNTKIKQADYATNIHLELYLEKDEDENISENDYRIEYYYNDEFLLSLPYADFKIKFVNELYDKNNITDFCAKGDEDKDDDKNQKLYLIGIFVGLGIVIILVIIIIIVLRKRIKKNNEELLAEENDALIRESKMTTE